MVCHSEEMICKYKKLECYICVVWILVLVCSWIPYACHTTRKDVHITLLLIFLRLSKQIIQP